MEDCGLIERTFKCNSLMMESSEPATTITYDRTKLSFVRQRIDIALATYSKKMPFLVAIRLLEF